jgi:hypothetical protein
LCHCAIFEKGAAGLKVLLVQLQSDLVIGGSAFALFAFGFGGDLVAVLREIEGGPDIIVDIDRSMVSTLVRWLVVLKRR